MGTHRGFLLLALSAVFAPAAIAQDTVPPPPSPPERALFRAVKTLGGTAESLFDRPLHPIVKGVASGGGLGGGLAYNAPMAEPWDVNAEAVITMREYWSLRAIAGYHTHRVDAEAYARSRDMNQLSFFGPGNESSVDDRTTFRLRDKVAGAWGAFDLTPWFRLGGRAEQYWPEVGSGKSESVPSTEAFFVDAAVPGLIEQPKFTRLQAQAELRLLPGAGESFHQGTRIRLGQSWYTDHDFQRYSFRMYDVEAQQKFAMPFPHHRLTLHAWASSAVADAGQRVPFYLQRTLGGKGNLRSIHDDLIGSDGTSATLRSFRSYRFRDLNHLLLQAEYRLPIWGPVDGSVFFDAGKVAPTRSELDLKELHQSYGFSLSLMKAAGTALRTDVAFGREGTRFLISVGKDIVP